MSITTFRMRPRQVATAIERILTRGLVPFIQSSPGMGKTALVKAFAAKYRLKVLDTSASTMAPTDISGLPDLKGDKAKFIPFENFPVEGDEVPEGYDGWLVFLDEFNSGSKAVQAAMYKVVLNKEVGLNKLHEKVMIVTAGNLATDRAIVNSLGTAMQSRLIHLEMEMESDQARKEFLKDVVIGQKWDWRIAAYLAANPDRIHDFRSDHNDKTFECPRTWEFVHQLIDGVEYTVDDQGNYDMSEDTGLIAGAIGSGGAVGFVAFTKVFSFLPKLEDILVDPEAVPIPVDRPTQFASMTSLVNSTTKENFDKVTAYVNRHVSEFRLIYFRSLMVSRPDLRGEPSFRKAMLELQRYLND